MANQFANFARSRITGNMATGDTTLTVQSGSVFPSTGNFFVVIGNEVILCTAISGNTLTVVRAQQGTTATTHNLGDLITRSITRDDVISLSTVFDTYANRPAPGIAGRLFMGSNTPMYSYDDGTQWRSRILGQNVIEYNDVGFTWLNQGTAVVDTTYGFGSISIPTATGTNFRGRYINAITPPYYLHVCMNWTQINVNFQSCGIIWRSTDGKFTLFGVNEGGNFCIFKYNNPNSFNAAYTPFATVPAAFANTFVWLRFYDDGATTRWCQVSNDALYWITIFNVSRTDFHTPTQIGWGMNAEHNLGGRVNMFSWQNFPG